MNRIIIYPSAMIEEVYQHIRANNLKVQMSDLKQLFGEANTHYALIKLQKANRVRRVRTWHRGIVYVYKILE